MEEKIKIYIPESINNILLKDMERFEFYKKDGSFNKNEFYNSLILNYYQQYQNNQSNFFDHIKKTINDNVNCSTLTVNDITAKILDYVDLKTNNLIEQKSEVSLSIKPTKRTSDVFDFIQDYCIHNSTLSGYFRNMFASYSLLPQDKRERIIFRNNFDLIDKAIKEKRKLYFTTTNNDAPHIASPYSISNSKEELFNYLLAEYNSYPYSFRVGRLKKLSILNEPSEIQASNIVIFQKMEEQGPQYNYEVKKVNQQIKVFLNDKGKQMFNSIYLHRPKCTKIEADYYYFECSLQQAYQYFCRFGRNAIVVEPSELTENLRNYYLSANKAYCKFLKEKEIKKTGFNY